MRAAARVRGACALVQVPRRRAPAIVGCHYHAKISHDRASDGIKWEYLLLVGGLCLATSDYSKRRRRRAGRAGSVDALRNLALLE